MIPLEAWEKAPVFRRKGGSPRDRHSYRKRWRDAFRSAMFHEVRERAPDRAAALAKARAGEEGFVGGRVIVCRAPGLKGMIPRDLRKTANTEIRSKGTDQV